MKLLDLQIIRVNAGDTRTEAKQLIHKLYSYEYSWSSHGDKNTTHWNKTGGMLDYIIVENHIYYITPTTPIDRYAPCTLPKQEFIERLKRKPIY